MDKASCVLPFVPVRAKPDDGSTQVTQALFADPLAVVAQDNGWTQVSVDEGMTGFVHSDALGEPLPKERAHVVVVPQAADRYLGTWLPAPGLRTEPLAAARRKASGEAIADTALMFLGAPYEWGGVTVVGLDCSGLVQAVHRRFGLLLPHSAAEQEQTSFDVVLTAAGPQKIPVIMVIRELTGLGLKEAKSVADEAPKPVKEGVTREEADSIKAKLEEAGATVEVK